MFWDRILPRMQKPHLYLSSGIGASSLGLTTTLTFGTIVTWLLKHTTQFVLLCFRPYSCVEAAEALNLVYNIPLNVCMYHNLSVLLLLDVSVVSRTQCNAVVKMRFGWKYTCFSSRLISCRYNCWITEIYWGMFRFSKYCQIVFSKRLYFKLPLCNGGGISTIPQPH